MKVNTSLTPKTGQAAFSAALVLVLLIILPLLGGTAMLIGSVGLAAYIILLPERFRSRSGSLKSAVCIVAVLAVASSTAQITPVLIGNVNVSNGSDGLNARAVAVSGNLACVANTRDGFLLYDVSNPSNPVEIGHDPASGSESFGYDVAIYGHYAFFANGGDGLRIYDISYPTNPAIAHIDTSGYAMAVSLSGSNAFVCTYNGNFIIYNVSNPANPVTVGFTNYGVYGRSISVSGNKAFMGYDDGGFRIYDISNAAKPVSIGFINTGSMVSGISISGSVAYLANWNVGLTIYDISDLANPRYVGRNPTNYGGYACSVAIAGNYAYVANGADGLRIYDVSNPAIPVNVGYFSDFGGAAGYANGVVVLRDKVYVAQEYGGLDILSVGTPTSPLLSINVISSTEIVLSWPAPTAAFIAQEKSDLISTNWVSLTNTPVVSRGQNQIVVPVRSSNALYRLTY